MNVASESILSRVPDGVGYYYGLLDDGRQLNVREESDGWYAFVSSLDPVAGPVPSKAAAEVAGREWARKHPEG